VIFYSEIQFQCGSIPHTYTIKAKKIIPVLN